MTVTTQEANELQHIAQQNSALVQVGHLERFNQAYLSVVPLLTRPTFIQAQRLAPFNPRGADVNVILDLMIHDIDLILHTIQSPVEVLVATGQSLITQDIDIASAHLQFANGAMAHLTASRVAPKGSRILEIQQPGTLFYLDLQSQTATHYLADTTEQHPGVSTLKTITPSIARGDALHTQAEAFIQSITQNTTPAVTASDGIQALELASQITSLIESQQKAGLAVEGQHYSDDINA